MNLNHDINIEIYIYVDIFSIYKYINRYIFYCNFFILSFNKREKYIDNDSNFCIFDKN